MARSLALALAFFLAAPRAFAEANAGLELDWHAPIDCPTAGAVREQIASLVDASDESSSARSVRAKGYVTATHGAYHLDLVLRDGSLSAERQFDGDSCVEVTGAAAVAIALLLRSTREDGAESTAPPTDAAENTRKLLDGANDEATVSKQKPGDEQVLHVVLLAPTFGAGFGLFRETSLGLAAGIALEPGRWRFGLSGTWRPDLTLPAVALPGTTVSASRQTISAQGCRFLVSGLVELAPCFMLSLQVLSVGGTGTEITASQADTVWLALGPTALGRLRLGRSFALAANVGLEVETARPRLVIEGLGTVEQVGPLEFTVSLGAEWIL